MKNGDGISYDPPNSNSQLYPLKVVAAGQVVKAGVGDQGTVVQLQHHQVLTGTGGQAQVPGEHE